MRSTVRVVRLQRPPCTKIPVEDLFAGPEHDAGPGPDVLERFAEVAEAVRRAHDVRVDDDRHDAGGLLRIGVQLFELIDGTVPVFSRGVMLDQHHCHVVAFLGIRYRHQRTTAGLQHDRLIVEHPVAHVFVAGFGQDVRRVPRLGQPRAKPAARRTAGERAKGVGRFPDVGALVGDFLHVLLREPVADELPSAVERGARDRFVGLDRRSVDRQHGRHLEPIEHLEHPPEPHPIPVLVPGPIRNVRFR